MCSPRHGTKQYSSRCYAWPGLCVSVKHNSVFASFALLNKGDYNYELNIPIPFSLISNDPLKDELIIMPGYWFLYNFYALARNAWKYIDRDKRTDKTPIFEYNYLAPDSVNELLNARKIIAAAVAKAYLNSAKKSTAISNDKLIELGGTLLTTKTKKEIDALSVFGYDIENSKRKTRLIKTYEAYSIFEKMIFLYGMEALVEIMNNKSTAKKGGQSLLAHLKTLKPNTTELFWVNVGGQLIPQKAVSSLLTKIKSGAIESWDQIHQFYEDASSTYTAKKRNHALLALELITKKKLSTLTSKQLNAWLDSYLEIKTDINSRIEKTRAKDYSNPFRKMVYENEAEMIAVVGDLKDNGFIKEQKELLKATVFNIATLKVSLKTK
jgi:hypothetical protein